MRNPRQTRVGQHCARSLASLRGLPVNQPRSLAVLIVSSLLAACASEENCVRWEERTAYREKCMQYDGGHCVNWGTEPYTKRYCAEFKRKSTD